MAGQTHEALKAKNDAAWRQLNAVTQGMEPHLERSDAPGEWTTRQVLTHLSFAPGWDPVATLRSFAERDLPLIEIQPGNPYLTDDRKGLSLAQLLAAIDAQRQKAFAYVASLSDADLANRKARVPLFKPFLGTDEVPLQTFAGAIWDSHWRDHIGQLTKIRKAVGLPEAT
jgi:hypothetical protein